MMIKHLHTVVLVQHLMSWLRWRKHVVKPRHDQSPAQQLRMQDEAAAVLQDRNLLRGLSCGIARLPSAT